VMHFYRSFQFVVNVAAHAGLLDNGDYLPNDLKMKWYPNSETKCISPASALGKAEADIKLSAPWNPAKLYSWIKKVEHQTYTKTEALMKRAAEREHQQMRDADFDDDDERARAARKTSAKKTVPPRGADNEEDDESVDFLTNTHGPGKSSDNERARKRREDDRPEREDKAAKQPRAHNAGTAKRKPVLVELIDIVDSDDDDTHD
jgi:hypothetical protein